MDIITTHQTDVLALALSHYDDSPRLRTILELIGAEIQRLENCAHSVYTARMLDAAEGTVLDIIGKIVQAPRLGDTDTVYRGIIEASIASNVSTTHGDYIATIATALVGKDVRYRWDGPMNMDLEYETDTPVTADHAWRAKQIIDRAVGGGVSWRLTEGVAGEAFHYTDGPGFGSGRLGRIVTRS